MLCSKTFLYPRPAAQEEQQHIDNDTRRRELRPIPDSIPTPPFQASYLPAGQTEPIALDKTSPDFGRAVEFIGHILRHISCSLDTAWLYKTIMSRIRSRSMLARENWDDRTRTKVLAARTKGLNLEGGQETDTFEGGLPIGGVSQVLPPHEDDVKEYVTKMAPRIIFASKESINDEGDYEGNSNELVISEALARVFNDTQDPAGNSRDDISDERFAAVKLYIQFHFLSTILHKLAHAVTQEFFGPNFVTPKLGSLMGGEVGTDIEVNALGVVGFLEWPKDVFLRDGQSDEERLWAVTKLIGKQIEMYKIYYVEIDKEALQLLIDSIKCTVLVDIDVTRLQPLTRLTVELG